MEMISYIKVKITELICFAIPIYIYNIYVSSDPLYMRTTRHNARECTLILLSNYPRASYYTLVQNLREKAMLQLYKTVHKASCMLVHEVFYIAHYDHTVVLR
jgi:hypothetical protein